MRRTKSTAKTSSCRSMKVRQGPGRGSNFSARVTELLDRNRAGDDLVDGAAFVGPAVGVDADPFARGAAEEVVDGHAGLLADDVPEGHLDRAPGREEADRGAADDEIVEEDLAEYGGCCGRCGR